MKYLARYAVSYPLMCLHITMYIQMKSNSVRILCSSISFFGCPCYYYLKCSVSWRIRYNRCNMWKWGMRNLSFPTCNWLLYLLSQNLDSKIHHNNLLNNILAKVSFSCCVNWISAIILLHALLEEGKKGRGRGQGSGKLVIFTEDFISCFNII